MLELKNITLKWNSPNEKFFIKDLNLKIKNGEILCVFGASGVGKSSLINVIAGVSENDLKFQGEIILNGKNLNFSILPRLEVTGITSIDAIDLTLEFSSSNTIISDPLDFTS